MRHPLRPRLPAVLAASLAVAAVGGLTGAALVVDTGPPVAAPTAEMSAAAFREAVPDALHQSTPLPRTPVTTPPAPAPLALAGAVRAAAAARAEADRTPCPGTRAAAPRLPGGGSREGCPESPTMGPTGPPLSP
ncbi:hypothetical protein GCM10023215_66360 [Pseudonocardia yuanmonensis]|uniref:Uncharacterized protein n=1 Tax=Pseudonocardia yuanmonensis TaxID=1095914 RepID=A0ABP8XT42_9PSEU